MEELDYKEQNLVRKARALVAVTARHKAAMADLADLERHATQSYEELVAARNDWDDAVADMGLRP